MTMSPFTTVLLSFTTGLLLVNAAFGAQGQGQNKKGQGKNNCIQDTNCVKCAVKSGMCQYCRSGFSLNVTMNACVAKPRNNCHRFCTSSCSQSGAGHCDSTCEPGYVLNNTICKSCDNNCNLSSGCAAAGPGRCDSTCNDGYVLVHNFCQKCAEHCTSGCTDKGPPRCDSACEVGWVLDNNTHICLACDVNCNSSSGCQSQGPAGCDTSCNKGYVLRVRSAGMPKTCLRCDVNCLSKCDVNGPGTCDSACNPGYRLNTTHHRCEPCAAHCDPVSGCDASGAFHCDNKCKTGYVLDKALKTCYLKDPRLHCSRQSSGCDTPRRGTSD